MRLAAAFWLLAVAVSASPEYLSAQLGHCGNAPFAGDDLAVTAGLSLLIASFFCAAIGREHWTLAKRRTLLARCCIGTAAWMLVFLLRPPFGR